MTFEPTTGSSTRGSTTRIVRGGTATVAIVRSVLVWRRIRGWITTAWRETLATVSAAGWLVIGAAITGLTVGVAFGWVEFVAVGVVALITVLVSTPFLFGAKAYDVHLALKKDRIVVGQHAEATLTIRNAGSRVALPGFLDVPIGNALLEVPVPLLTRGAEREERLAIPGLARGIVSVGPVSAVRSDPLSLFRRERTWEDMQTLYVHPVTTPLPSMLSGFIRDLEGQPSRTIVNDDLSFHAIREYRPGDSRRHIHWKSTAKTGTLMVRQYEETRRSEMVITLASKFEEFRNLDEFELAVSVCGSLGIRALTDGRNLRMNLSAEVPEFARRSIGSIHELNVSSKRTLLDELSGVSMSEHRHSLIEVTTLSNEHWGNASIAFLVVGSGLTAHELRRATLSFPSNMGVIAVVCDQHAEPGMWTLGETTVLTVGLIDDLRELLLRGGSRVS